jgi:hypothetical protein
MSFLSPYRPSGRAAAGISEHRMASSSSSDPTALTLKVVADFVQHWAQIASTETYVQFTHCTGFTVRYKTPWLGASSRTTA